MTRQFLALALAACTAFAVPEAAQAANANVRVGVSFSTGFVNFAVGTAAFNQRYVVAGQAWVNEPYVYWINVPDPTTGKVYRVQRIGYTRRLVVLYLDTWTGTYGYFDRWGNPVPWQPNLWYRRF